MYIVEVKRYKVVISASDINVFDPVIEEANRDVILCAYSIAVAYTSNGRVRKVEAIKAIRDITRKLDGKMWSLKSAKLFVEKVMDDRYYSFKNSVNGMFYEQKEDDVV